MSFVIFNRQQKPLYIDWKKSAYIDNSVKLNYWIDEEKMTSTEYYGSYLYNGPLIKPDYAVGETVGIKKSSNVKVERITFIPPKSKSFRSKFYILPVIFCKLMAPESYEVQRNDDTRKKTIVYEKSYENNNSPVVFRNFLTFSYSENFESEFYVDNEFYLSKIMEMERGHFENYIFEESNGIKQITKDKYGKPNLYRPFRKESSFYIFIPRGGSVEHRD